MCTAVGWPTPEGYLLAFNRDELLSRAPALPPEARGGWLAPIDPEGGGTWLAVNTAGLTLAALNVYTAAAQAPLPPIRSRGLLITDLIAAADLRAVATNLRNHPALAHTRPFHILALALPGTALDCVWDGARLQLTPAKLPLLRVSAALDPAAVQRARNLEFTRLSKELKTTVPSEVILRRWFASHTGNGAPRGVCMHREPLAATVSHSLVTVTARTVRFDYLAGPACQNGLQTAVTLARA